MTDDRRPIIDPATGEIIDGWYAHPAADLFPMAQPDELDGLTSDIKQNGLVEAIWTSDDNVVLDGRNRLVACHRLGKQPTVRRYRGDDPVTFAVSLNLHRRHLTNGQVQVLGLEIQPLYAEQARKRQAEAGKRFGVAHPKKLEAHGPQASASRRAPQARDLAAAAVGTSGRSLARTKRIADQAPDLIAEMKAGTLAPRRAERLLKERLRTHAEIKNAADTADLFRADAAERAREEAENPGDHELRILLGVLQNADDRINAVNHQLVKTATDERAWKRHARLVANLETTINKLKETQR